MTSVAEFYKGRSVLITGFTGFLGKVVVEKLIRSCPDVESIYVLVRPLKGKDSNQRVAKILESTVSFFFMQYRLSIVYFTYMVNRL